MAESEAIQVLKDCGVLGPKWVAAWYTLKSALGDLIIGRRGVGEVEAITWVTQTYELLAEAKNALLWELDKEYRKAGQESGQRTLD